MSSADCQTNFDMDVLQNLVLDSEYVGYGDEDEHENFKNGSQFQYSTLDHRHQRNSPDLERPINISLQVNTINTYVQPSKYLPVQSISLE